MTAYEILKATGPLLSALLEQKFARRDLCILATRVAIETAAYFGIKVSAMPVKVCLYNATFARHAAEGFAGVDAARVREWGDDSWSVGIGCGKPNAPNRWDGHLIAVADGCFGDFSIQQAERLEHNIRTGPALVGPYGGESTWKAIHVETGTVIEYCGITSSEWRNAPDWKDEKRRRPVVAKLIRTVRGMNLEGGKEL